jgi:membrane protein
MVELVKSWFGLLKSTVNEFISDNVIKLSASLAYYTVFSIGPMLLVVISLAGLFFDKEIIRGRIYWQASSLIGKQGAEQIKSIIENIQHPAVASRFSMIGVIILIFGATSIFADIQDSINYIWSIRAKPKKGWLKFLRNRLLSFSLIIGMGFLLMVSLFVNTLTDLLTDRLQQLFNIETVIFFKILNVAILFFIITGLFAVIYKVLPDAEIRWKDAFIGAFFTGIFFLIGKFLIGYYLGNSQIGNTYGAAASVIIILAWVYYTSIILYFGAEFTKVYALTKGGGIEPYETAVFIIKREAKELPNSSGAHN